MKRFMSDWLQSRILPFRLCTSLKISPNAQDFDLTAETLDILTSERRET